MRIMIPGKPIPKHRPRFSRTGHVYSDQGKDETDIALLIRTQWQYPDPYRIPVRLDITFFMPIPKSLSKKKRQELGGTAHFKKPDTDNLLKMCLDCIVKAGNVITDDAIISQIHVIKIYSSQPRTEIDITPF